MTQELRAATVLSHTLSQSDPELPRTPGWPRGDRDCPGLLALSSARVFGHDGSAVPALSKPCRSVLGLQQFQQELQRNEGGGTPRQGTGSGFKYLQSCRNVPEVRGAGCGAQLRIQSTAPAGTACSSTSAMGIRRICCNQNRSLKSLAISGGHSVPGFRAPGMVLLCAALPSGTGGKLQLKGLQNWLRN